MIHPIDQLKLIQPEKKDDSAAQLISIGVLFAGLYLLLRKPEQAVGESIIESGNPYTITKNMQCSMWSSHPLGIIKIDPEDFLDLTTDDPDELSPDTKSAIYADNKKKGVKYSDYENAGLRGDIDVHPFLEVNVDTGKVTAHEGRHRAVAAKQAGEDFYIFILPYYKNKNLKLIDDVLKGNGEKYIPDVLIGQMNLKIRVKLDKSTIKKLSWTAGNPSQPYHIEHINGTAPDHENGSPLYDVTKNGTYPKDFYSSEGFRYYADFGNSYDRLNYSLVCSLRNRPNARVTVYRAVPKSLKRSQKKINPGDWVTLVREVAKEHGLDALNGEYSIISTQIFARSLFTVGDSLLEWGYDPQPKIVGAPNELTPSESPTTS